MTKTVKENFDLKEKINQLKSLNNFLIEKRTLSTYYTFNFKNLFTNKYFYFGLISDIGGTYLFNFYI